MTSILPMVDYPPAHGSTAGLSRRRSASTIGWIVFASLLCGAGLFLVAYFLAFFAWWSFSGAAMVVVGFLIFFKQWTGPEAS